MTRKIYLFWLGFRLSSSAFLSNGPLNAQTAMFAQVLSPTLPTSGTPLPSPQEVLPRPNTTPTSPLPSITPSKQAPSDPIFGPGIKIPPSAPIQSDIPETITVRRFEIIGSTVLTADDFQKITKDYISPRRISLPELFELRNKITKLYYDKGYITSGAYIPVQELDNGIIKIQISEGGVEDIRITGTKHLNPSYIRSRIALGTTKPLNKNQLIEALQLLRLKDTQLIKTISAELSTGTQPGESLVEVAVTENPRWDAQVMLDNGRTPSVGTFRRQLQLTNFNLLGVGDNLGITYTNTAGSNSIDTSYTIPINPRNGKLTLRGGLAFSHIVEAPFEILDVNSKSNYLELTIRQPILQTPTREFALGLTASHRESGATLLGGAVPFPSLGADDTGTTRINALRFFQDYTVQDKQQVLALRSQFSIGLGTSGALTTTANIPGGNFFVWRGQSQYINLLAEDTLLLLQGDVQLANRSLVPLEQLGLGGQDSVRGYRQDQLLTDSGIFLSAEVRFPIFKIRDPKIVLQIAPFIDFGHGFNQGGATNPSPNNLFSVGLGFRFNLSDRLTARLDWGIPLTSISGSKKTLQERGYHFSLNYKLPF